MLFSVDFEVLQQIAQMYTYSGIFHTVIQRKGQQPMMVDVLFQQGKAIDARMSNISPGQKWTHWQKDLARVGVVDWKEIPIEQSLFAPTKTVSPINPLTPTPTRTTSDDPQKQKIQSQTRLELVPRRTGPIAQELLQQLPPLYRQIYLLCDGRRTIAVILTLLRKDPNEVLQVLENLKRSQLLEI